MFDACLRPAGGTRNLIIVHGLLVIEHTMLRVQNILQRWKRGVAAETRSLRPLNLYHFMIEKQERLGEHM